MIGNYEQTYVEAIPPVDITAGLDANYISMKGYDHCTIVINTGAWASGDADITINKATDVSTSDETTLTFS